MAIRVALLILVTGAFAALWSGDHPDQISAVSVPVKSTEPIRDLSPGSKSEPLARTTAGKIDASLLVMSPNIAPLPEGITAGTYLVADQMGRTQIQIVRPDDVKTVSPAAGTVMNHYSIERLGSRWHFIRIESGHSPQTTERPAGQSIR